jgi:transcription antitermination factor NusA-like protein
MDNRKVAQFEILLDQVRQAYGHLEELVKLAKELTGNLKKVSDGQVDKIVEDGMNNIYFEIQKKMGVESGDVASTFHSGDGDELEKKLKDFFKEYVEYELSQEDNS